MKLQGRAQPKTITECPQLRSCTSSMTDVSPLSLRISPPPPARPGLPNNDPSELSLYELNGGFNHLTCMFL